MSTSELKEQTIKGLFWGGMGTFVFQIISMGFGIFLARLLNAEDYGIVGLLAVFSQLAAAFQESGFTKALINRSEIKKSDYDSVFWFSIVTGVICYSVLFFLAPLIADFYEEPRLTALSRYAFLSILISGLGVAPSAYMSKKLMVKGRALSSWIALVSSSLVGLFMAFEGYAHWGIVTQSNVYVLVSTFFFLIFSGYKPGFSFDMKAIKEMFRFGGHLLLTRIVSVVNGNIFSVFLGKFYSIGSVGYYNQANKWAWMGCYTIANTLLGVEQPVIVSIKDDKKRQLSVFRKILRFNSFVAFPALLGLGFVANEFIVLALTEKWQESATMMAIICVGYSIYTVNFVFTEFLLGKGYSALYLIVSSISGVLQIMFLFLFSGFGIYAIVASNVALQLINLFVWYFFANKRMDYRFRYLIIDVFSYAFVAVVSIVVAYLITLSVSNIVLLFILKVTLVALIYVMILYLLKSVMLQESFALVKNFWMKVLRKK